MTLDRKNLGIIIFLLITIVIIGFLAFQNYQDYSKLQLAFKEEKIELQEELDKIVSDYDKAISEKISISKELRKERFRVIQFRDTIKNLKEKNFNLIRIYRKRTRKLENQNKILLAKVDSLNKENSNLIVENIAVKEKLNDNKKLTYKLYDSNKSLKKYQESLLSTVKKAQALEVSNITVIPMKKRDNGKFTSTSRSRKTEAFKITLDVLKNEIAEEGERKVYVQIVDNNSNIISPDGSLILKDGSKMIYSDSFLVDYKKTTIALVSFVEVPRGSITRGEYVVKIFLEDCLVGGKVIKLK